MSDERDPAFEQSKIYWSFCAVIIDTSKADGFTHSSQLTSTYRMVWHTTLEDAGKIQWCSHYIYPWQSLYLTYPLLSHLCICRSVEHSTITILDPATQLFTFDDFRESNVPIDLAALL